MANERKEFREVSYIEESAKEGLLFSAWTQTWGLKVTPWYSMDRIKFSFIEKGSGGKGKSFDICINTMKDFSFDFMDMAHEVLHDIRTPYDFVSVLAAEKEAGEKYPKRYKFVTGANGEKSLGFCNSTNGGYCLNAQTKVGDQKVYVNIPMSYYDIYDIVSAFYETYQSRREELKRIRDNGVVRVEENYRKFGSPEYEADAETPQEPTTASNEVPGNDDTVIQMRVSVSKPVKEANGVTFSGTDKEDNSPVELFASNQVLTGEQKDRWRQLASALEYGSRVVSFNVRTGEDKLYIESIV